MKNSLLFICLLLSILSLQCTQQGGEYNGIHTDLGNLQKLSNAKTRSISPENFTGAKGQGGMDKLSDTTKPHHALAAEAARELGQGWKLNPAVKIEPGETFTLGEIDGPGAIQHIWMTPSQSWKLAILRIYWDGEKTPSVECPVGDFFCMGLDKYSPVNSLPVVVNPGSGFNSYWTMPFRKHCKITIENLNKEDFYVFYQIDYVLSDVDKNDAYFHAQYRQSDPKDSSSIYTIADSIQGQGQYVGVYMTWKPNNPGWWGEGEIKFYMDGDTEFPTIIGTGTEDYFLGSYGWHVNGKPTEYTTNYSGVPQIIEPDSSNKLKYPSFGMYRWHIKDPIRFSKDLRVTMQDLGWKTWGLYLAQHSTISSVVYWYQAEPHGAFPKLPSTEELKMQ